MPARVAACWPKLRLSQIGRTNGYFSASAAMVSADAVGTVVVDEQPLDDRPLVTVGLVWVPRERGDLLGQGGQGALTLVDGGDDGDPVGPGGAGGLGHGSRALSAGRSARPDPATRRVALGRLGRRGLPIGVHLAAEPEVRQRRT